MRKIAIGISSVLFGILWIPGMASALQAVNPSCQVRDDKSSPVRTLIHLLDNPDYRVRRSASVKLRSYGKEACLMMPKLIEALKDWHPSVVISVMDTLASDNFYWSANGAQDQLQRLLRHPEPQVRASAAHALGRIAGVLQDDLIVPDLVLALKDSDARVRAAALLGLGEFTDWNQETSQATVDAIEPLLQDADSNVRIAAIEAFGAIVYVAPPQRWSPTVRPTLKALFQGNNLAQKVAVINTWGAMGLSEEAPQLIPLLTDSRSEFQYAAEEALVAMEYLSPETVNQLLPLLKNENLKTRLSALRILGGMGSNPKIVAAIVPLLSEAYPQARATAALSLGRMTELSPDRLPLLLSLLEDSDPDVRATTLIALRMIGRNGKSAIPQITRMLKDPNPDVRANAIEALLFVEEYEKVLLQAIVLLKDPDQDVRKSALMSLRFLGVKSPHYATKIVVAARPMLNDSSLQVRNEAKLVMATLDEIK